MIDGLKPYNRYTESGLPWLGEIPSHWKVDRTKTQFRLRIEKSGMDHGKELLSIYTHIGVRPRKDLEQKGNRASTTNDYWVVRKGDIIVNKLLAWMGAVGVSHYDGVTSPAYDILRPVKPLEPDYYHYLFRTQLYKQQFKIRSRGIMEMRLRLYFDQLGQIPLLCPPPEEQAAIVRFLDHADRRIRRYIRAKRQLIALLNEQKQAIIHRAVTRGLDPHVKLKPSGIEWLGDVPEHWEVTSVKHQFKCLNSRRIPLSSPERGEMKKREYDYYGASGVIDQVEDFIFDDELLLIAEDGANLVLRNLPLALIARGKFWVNNHAHILKPRTGNLEYLAHFMETLNYLPWISGAAQPKLTKDRLLSILIAVAPVDEQEEIVCYINAESGPIDNAAARARSEVDLLREFRTRLISDVVTGKLDVRDAAAALPDELEGIGAEPDAEELLDEDATTDDVELDTEPEEVEA